MQIQAKDPCSPPEATLSPHIQGGGELCPKEPEVRAEQQQGSLWVRLQVGAPSVGSTCTPHLPPHPPRPGAPSVSPFPGPIPLHPGLGPPPSGSSVHLGPAFPIRRKDEGPRLAPSLPCGYCSWLEAAPPLFCVPAGASTQLRALGRESRGGALSGMRRHLSPPGGAPCLSQIHPGSLSPPKISFRFRSLAVTRPGPFHALPGQAWCVRRNGLRVPEGRGWGPPPG